MSTGYRFTKALTHKLKTYTLTLDRNKSDQLILTKTGKTHFKYNKGLLDLIKAISIYRIILSLKECSFKFCVSSLVFLFVFFFSEIVSRYL